MIAITRPKNKEPHCSAPQDAEHAMCNLLGA
jgi:hypothetical protein